MATDSLDARIRRQAFDWLAEQVEVHGDVLPRQLLAEGSSATAGGSICWGPRASSSPGT